MQIAQESHQHGSYFTGIVALSLARGDMLFLLNSGRCLSKQRVEAFVGRHVAEKLFFGFSSIEPIDENGKSIKSFSSSAPQLRNESSRQFRSPAILVVPGVADRGVNRKFCVKRRTVEAGRVVCGS